mmetsp:Transcript_14602/g.26463  ORF Transcript_14602/g.26463 Transcript_14602/m.26463 type:complete len:99 (+) Transcript_14602:156-452(+)|eukprot:CAMPEP_0202480232 /NCGR_PEP_ID=MMETSP1361-20130828/306_1 /ASSEMBLY_ACC=CAM_ASM_000849 /TAXON_ID=210615 /ORGANISM="Staurosira complex sp., Strain CCMP2646" /LENGTH=98 /DNA_ID=CAMNT_0049107651 /DNA_START=133 /DNA_END=429 /DNA_ORIENTATION=+
MYWLKSTLAAAELTVRRFLAPAPSLQLAGMGGMQVLQESLWFAVPKRKVTRSKKRMKTTKQYRIPLRQDIIADPRTGEPTLRHRLPFNWRESYIPKYE